MKKRESVGLWVQLAVLAVGITVIGSAAETLTYKERSWDYAPHLDKPGYTATVVHYGGDLGVWKKEKVHFLERKEEPGRVEKTDAVQMAVNNPQDEPR